MDIQNCRLKDENDTVLELSVAGPVIQPVPPEENAAFPELMWASTLSVSIANGGINALSNLGSQ